jgi:hypothetical protein
VPVAVWIAAAANELFSSCDYDCGDNVQFLFLLVVLTLPLIPLGVVWLLGRLPRAGGAAVFLVVACLLFAAWFGLIGGPLLLGCLLLVIAALVVVRRRLGRRYPSGAWPRSGR